MLIINNYRNILVIPNITNSKNPEMDSSVMSGKIIITTTIFLLIRNPHKK